MKIPPEEWARIATSYEVAWQALDPGAVLAALQAAMARKAGQPTDFAPRPPPGPAAQAPHTRTVGAGASAVDLPWRQRDDPVATVLDQTIAKVAAQVLCAGDTVVQLGAGAGQAALGLAHRVGHHGRLVAFEPRRELHQRLCANLAAAGIHHAETHAVMPEGEGWALRDVHHLYASDEHQPLQLANSTVPEPVVCWPLDALNLVACRLLVVCLPLPLLSVLQGARATLERLRPVVLAGVLPLRTSAAFEAFFASLGYRVRLVELGDASHPDRPALFGILVAEPPRGT
jgi:FkbM family methyltransferase